MCYGTAAQKDIMRADDAFKNSICSEYEEILYVCKAAFDAFQLKVEKLYNSGVIRSQIAEQTSALQSEYHEAYEKLVEHRSNCKMCQLASELTQASASNIPNKREEENQ